MTVQEIISILGVFGLGTFIGAFGKAIFGFIYKKKETTHQTEHTLREVRYKAIILLLYAMLDFEREKDNLKKFGRDYETKEQLLEEIKAEWKNMILFSSDKAIIAVKTFIENPNEENFFEVAISFRKDLYGLKTNLKPSNLKLYTQNFKSN